MARLRNSDISNPGIIAFAIRFSWESLVLSTSRLLSSKLSTTSSPSSVAALSWEGGAAIPASYGKHRHLPEREKVLAKDKE